VIHTSPHKNISQILGTSSPEEMDTRAQGSDRFILMVVMILLSFGLLAVYSSIAFFAQNNDTSAFTMVSRHLMKIAVAVVVILIASKVNYHTVARFSRPMMIASLLLLVMVLVFGEEQFGAKRWLSIGGFSFQPSTVAAVSLIIHVSVLLTEKQEYIKDFKRAFMPIMVWVFATCALIGVEDFSTAGLLMGICLMLMFVGRISVVQLGSMVVLALLGGMLLINQSATRQDRIDQYLGQIKHIETERLLDGTGRQAQQAHIAIAQGELTGVGIGKSTQRDFLPTPYNDFIFAIIAEEYGLLGSALLIGLFVFLLIRGVAFVARSAEDALGSLLALGCTLYVCLYGFVNAAVASGLFPVTGLPMPFVSYGGTNLLFAGVVVGILLNISKHKRDRRPLFYA
jgi:cell division protein FtsW